MCTIHAQEPESDSRLPVHSLVGENLYEKIYLKACNYGNRDVADYYICIIPALAVHARISV
jgi:hypothetical protein